MYVTGGITMMEAMVSVPLISSMLLSPLCNVSMHIFHSAVVLFRSREHAECGPQPGFVRAHIESTFIYMRTKLMIL